MMMMMMMMTMNVHLKRILFYIFDIKTLNITNKQKNLQSVRNFSFGQPGLKCFLFFTLV